MGTDFEGGKPWKAITRLCQGDGRRYAAVAFVGKDAPGLMPLRKGDVLVANAGNNALKSHATSPAALRHYFDAGVQLYGHDNLHAKLLAVGDSAVIGSANASANSTRLIEAVVITSDPAIARSVRHFITDLTSEAVRLGEQDLQRAQDIYDSSDGRGAPPGTDAGGPIPDAPARFASNPKDRMFVIDGHRVAYTNVEQQAIGTSRRTARKRAGSRRDFIIEPFIESVSSRPSLREGDILVWVERDRHGDGDVWLCQVDSDPIPTGEADSVLYWLRRPAAFDALALSTVTVQLQRRGFSSGVGPLDRRVGKADLRAAIAALWCADQ